MERNGYYLTESCKLGKEYYIKVKSDLEHAKFKKVKFLSYRPHPGEVMVRDGNRSRMVYRSNLFSRQDDLKKIGVHNGGARPNKKSIRRP